MQAAHAFEVCPQLGQHGSRKHGDAIFAPLALANKDFLPGELNVLHAQPQALHEAQP
jgi:hypothetical protein